jgi:hypothetical protein
MVQIASGFASATESSRTSKSRPLTVLLVEDDPSLLSLTAYVFGNAARLIAVNPEDRAA